MILESLSLAPKVFAQAPSRPLSRQEEYATKALTQAPADLPDLPNYAGKKRFINGFLFPNRGPTYILVFHTDQDAKVLLDWYSQALSRTGWDITKANERYIRAVNKNNDNMCEVSASQLSAGMDVGMKSQLGIDYRVAKK